MARNGSGTYNRAVAPYVAGTTITAETVNSEMDDMAAALTQSMARDGQAPATANIPMGGFRLTGLGNAIANTDAAALGQVTSYALAKAGDTATGALGVIAGTAAAPGVFVGGDPNTGFFQAAAAPDTLSVSVGGTEIARYGTGGFMRLAAGTAAAPAFSFSVDTNTGIYRPAPASIGFSLNGAEYLRLDGSTLSYGNFDASVSSAVTLSLDGAIEITRIGGGGYIDIKSAAGEDADVRIQETDNGISFLTGGNGTMTPRMFIPGSGPVTVDDKALQIQRGTEQVVSGTPVNVDFLNIPAGVREVRVSFRAVSTNGNSPFLIQLGSGAFTTSGYSSQAAQTAGSNSHNVSTAGLILQGGGNASAIYMGLCILENPSGNIWVASGTLGSNVGANINYFAGESPNLSGALDRLRITTVNGTDIFDAGSAFNVSWRF